MERTRATRDERYSMNVLGGGGRSVPRISVRAAAGRQFSAQRRLRSTHYHKFSADASESCARGLAGPGWWPPSRAKPSTTGHRNDPRTAERALRAGRDQAAHPTPPPSMCARVHWPRPSPTSSGASRRVPATTATDRLVDARPASANYPRAPAVTATRSAGSASLTAIRWVPKTDTNDAPNGAHMVRESICRVTLDNHRPSRQCGVPQLRAIISRLLSCDGRR